MDIFFLSWAYDSRWFFKINNSYRQKIFLLPAIINFGSCIAIYMQNKINQSQYVEYLIQNITLLGLLGLLNLYLFTSVRFNSSQKLKTIKQNYIQIQQFTHDYQLKKLVWSKLGLFIVIVCCLQTIIQKMFLSRNHSNYQCQANKFRYWLDIAFYLYILLHIFVWFAVKITYLLSAWVFTPTFYLRLKRVIE